MIIRTKFLLVFLLTALVPLLLFSLFTVNASQTALKEKVNDNITTLILLKESEINAAIVNYEQQINFVAKRRTLLSYMNEYSKSGDPKIHDQINQLLVLIEQVPEEIRTVSVISMQGRVVGSTDAAQMGTPRTLQGRKTTFVLNGNSSPSLLLRSPIMDGARQVGEIEFVDQAEQLDTILHNTAGLGESGDVFFARATDEGGLVLSEGRFQGADVSHHNLATSAIITALRDRKDVSLIADHDDHTILVRIHYIPAIDASMVVTIDSTEALRASNQLRDNILLFSLVFSLLIILTILFFIHSITSPLVNIISVARKISAGNLDERALVLSKDEIGVLAVTLNSMLDDLQQSKVVLEKKVHERTQQLEDINKELESFSYSVSHDLRAPLRAIDGFSKILLEEYASKLDAEGKRVLQTIISSAQHMGQLIDDLLAFSRLGRQEVKKQEVNMRAQVKEVFEELHRLNPKQEVALKLKPLPTAHADAALVRQVWVNLLSNALKFTRHQAGGYIEVGAKDEKDATIYYVKDNGAGFDMAFVDKLFGVFQRLHDQKDFEGTGVGLAIVQRIIARHGGKVWAEGKVGEGATLSFTLPKDRNTKHRGKKE